MAADITKKRLDADEVRSLVKEVLHVRASQPVQAGGFERTTSVKSVVEAQRASLASGAMAALTDKAGDHADESPSPSSHEALPPPTAASPQQQQRKSTLLLEAMKRDAATMQMRDADQHRNLTNIKKPKLREHLEVINRRLRVEYVTACAEAFDELEPPNFHTKFVGLTADLRSMIRGIDEDGVVNASHSSQQLRQIRQELENLHREVYSATCEVMHPILSRHIMSGRSSCYRFTESTYVDPIAGLIFQRWPCKKAASEHIAALNEAVNDPACIFFTPFAMQIDAMGHTFVAQTIMPISPATGASCVVQDPMHHSQVRFSLEKIAAGQNKFYSHASINLDSIGGKMAAKVSDAELKDAFLEPSILNEEHVAKGCLVVMGADGRTYLTCAVGLFPHLNAARSFSTSTHQEHATYYQRMVGERDAVEGTSSNTSTTCHDMILWYFSILHRSATKTKQFYKEKKHHSTPLLLASEEDEKRFIESCLIPSAKQRKDTVYKHYEVTAADLRNFREDPDKCAATDKIEEAQECPYFYSPLDEACDELLSSFVAGKATQPCLNIASILHRHGLSIKHIHHLHCRVGERMKMVQLANELAGEAAKEEGELREARMMGANVVSKTSVFFQKHAGDLLDAATEQKLLLAQRACAIEATARVAKNILLAAWRRRYLTHDALGLKPPLQGLAKCASDLLSKVIYPPQLVDGETTVIEFQERTIDDAMKRLLLDASFELFYRPTSSVVDTSGTMMFDTNVFHPVLFAQRLCQLCGLTFDVTKGRVSSVSPVLTKASQLGAAPQTLSVSKIILTEYQQLLMSQVRFFRLRQPQIVPFLTLRLVDESKKVFVGSLARHLGCDDGRSMNFDSENGSPKSGMAGSPHNGVNRRAELFGDDETDDGVSGFNNTNQHRGRPPLPQQHRNNQRQLDDDEVLLIDDLEDEELDYPSQPNKNKNNSSFMKKKTNGSQLQMSKLDPSAFGSPTSLAGTMHRGFGSAVLSWKGEGFLNGSVGGVLNTTYAALGAEDGSGPAFMLDAEVHWRTCLHCLLAFETGCGVAKNAAGHSLSGTLAGSPIMSPKTSEFNTEDTAMFLKFMLKCFSGLSEHYSSGGRRLDAGANALTSIDRVVQITYLCKAATALLLHHRTSMHQQYVAVHDKLETTTKKELEGAAKKKKAVLAAGGRKRVEGETPSSKGAGGGDLQGTAMFSSPATMSGNQRGMLKIRKANMEQQLITLQGFCSKCEVQLSLLLDGCRHSLNVLSEAEKISKVHAVWLFSDLFDARWAVRELNAKVDSQSQGGERLVAIAKEKLSFMEETFGEDSMPAQVAQSDLAAAYMSKRDYQSARQLFNQSLASIKSHTMVQKNRCSQFDTKHREAAVTVNDFLVEEEHHDAVVCDHPNSWMLANNLATVLFTVADKKTPSSVKKHTITSNMQRKLTPEVAAWLQEAQDLLNSCLQYSRKISPVLLGDIYNNLGCIYMFMHKYHDAIQAFTSSLASTGNVLPDSHPDRKNAIKNRATAEKRQLAKATFTLSLWIKRYKARKMLSKKRHDIVYANMFQPLCRGYLTRRKMGNALLRLNRGVPYHHLHAAKILQRVGRGLKGRLFMQRAAALWIKSGRPALGSSKAPPPAKKQLPNLPSKQDVAKSPTPSPTSKPAPSGAQPDLHQPPPVHLSYQDRCVRTLTYHQAPMKLISMVPSDLEAYQGVEEEYLQSIIREYGFEPSEQQWKDFINQSLNIRRRAPSKQQRPKELSTEALLAKDKQQTPLRTSMHQASAGATGQTPPPSAASSNTSASTRGRTRGRRIKGTPPTLDDDSRRSSIQPPSPNKLQGMSPGAFLDQQSLHSSVASFEDTVSSNRSNAPPPRQPPPKRRSPRSSLNVSRNDNDEDDAQSTGGRRSPNKKGGKVKKGGGGGGSFWGGNDNEFVTEKKSKPTPQKNTALTSAALPIKLPGKKLELEAPQQQEAATDSTTTSLSQRDAVLRLQRIGRSTISKQLLSRLYILRKMKRNKRGGANSLLGGGRSRRRENIMQARQHALSSGDEASPSATRDNDKESSKPTAPVTFTASSGLVGLAGGGGSRAAQMLLRK